MTSNEGKLQFAVTSPFDSPADGELDGGDELSQYLSCGGESETERYCSAASAIGTPSVAGSSFRDSDLGSLKNLKVGVENSLLSDSWDERLFSSNPESRSNEEMLNFAGKREASSSNEAYWIGNGVVAHGEITDAEKVLDHGEPFLLSSEHSENDDDSMFGCDSDEERKPRFFFKNGVSHGIETDKNDNYFVMNSKVAFGSDDWDDFIHEMPRDEQTLQHSTIDFQGYDDVTSDPYSRVFLEGRESYSKSTSVDCSNGVVLEEHVEISGSSLREAFTVESEEIKDRGTISSEIESLFHDTAAKTSNIKEAPLYNDIVVAASDHTESRFTPAEMRDVELNDFYDEIVADMQDVLLDSCESPHSGIGHSSRMYQSQDGGSTASTSGTHFSYDGIHQLPKIDGVEVVGVRQKKGDVSFSERLVGVQKYVVYQIRVWSGDRIWEVERRYSDFSILYHRLKKSFSDNGLTLPSPWSSVERESWKLFGSTSPDVISDRSRLIQECLQSVIRTKFSGASLNSISCFLLPSESRQKRIENEANFGKTLSLVVDIQPSKSMKHMLELQYYRCAGCHRNFDDGISGMRAFVKAFGWGGPRFCEYTGQLFCSACHVNDMAVLPSKVLHFWDFTVYPVSQLAKSFLDSIHDQPMLCVGAVNPFLFSKVPTLQHVANTRNRIRAMLTYVRCPFRRSIDKGLGSRSYLLESNDFFALKDLIDLSKGVFSALAVMIEALSRKIHDHITEQCLVCYDAGIPCSSRQECFNPTALIFPFQEGDVTKCRTCESVYHKKCFKKMASSCPCGAVTNETKQIRNSNRDPKLQSSGSIGFGPGNRILSSLFPKVIPDHINSRKNATILMSSLPNISL